MSGHNYLEQALSATGAVLWLALVAGCASPASTAEEAEQRSTVAFDDYSKVLSISTPIPAEWNMGLFAREVKKEAQLLAAHRTIQNDYRLGLTLDWQGSGWLHLSEAIDHDGKRLSVANPHRTVLTGDLVREIITVKLCRQYLEERKESGLDIKFVGESGSTVIIVPPQYVSGFLKAVDARIPSEAQELVE